MARCAELKDRGRKPTESRQRATPTAIESRQQQQHRRQQQQHRQQQHRQHRRQQHGRLQATGLDLVCLPSHTRRRLPSAGVGSLVTAAAPVAAARPRWACAVRVALARAVFFFAGSRGGGVASRCAGRARFPSAAMATSLMFRTLLASLQHRWLTRPCSWLHRTRPHRVTEAGLPSLSTRHGRGDGTARNVDISLPSRQTLQRFDV